MKSLRLFWFSWLFNAAAAFLLFRYLELESRRRASLESY